MDKQNRFMQEIKKDWQIWAANGVPAYLNPSAYSGMILDEFIGSKYDSFLFYYKGNYAEMYYNKADFAKLWQIIQEKLVDDPNFLHNLRIKDYEIINPIRKIYREIDNLNIDDLSEEQLITFYHQLVQSQTDSIGIGHIIEPIGFYGEDLLRDRLKKEVADQSRINNYIIELTEPTTKSFIAEEENALSSIKKDGHDIEKQLLKHQKKYHWINNSYAGPTELSVKDFRDRLITLPDSLKQKNINKKKLITDLNLSKETQKLIEIINFATVWQDERKANCLKNISYLGKFIAEIARRTGIAKNHLNYLMVIEQLNISRLHDFQLLKGELAKRSKECYILMLEDQEFVLTKDDDPGFAQIWHKRFHEKMAVQMELRGSIANTGTAIGRVVVCKQADDFSLVKKGDILVTSMTRPEYMPILRKVAGIITDEGGITSHAAIIARELGIPAIIGTKIATKILKNGMLVEVRANHGLVRIIGEK